MTHNRRSVNFNSIIGTHDLVFITLDTLRYDVAAETFDADRTPSLKARMPRAGWQLRHSPGNFTFAAHQAFFAGFLPTPVQPGPHPRLFAATFLGSETTDDETYRFDAPDVVTGLRDVGYHTICLGGVGFFNKQTPLGCVLPDLFDESHWSVEFSVTHRDSTERQVTFAVERLGQLGDRKVFLFINVSALHQPNCHYLSGATEDSTDTQAAALEYVDACLANLFASCETRGPTFFIVCSDHGTAYGESGYVGHRLAHEVVWNVPYTEFVLGQQQ